MGYELHITRREFHADEDGPEISAQEWLRLIESDDELEPVLENGPYFARFLGDCEYGRGMGWFDWSEGCISTKNPDENILAKMLQLAETLDAQVQGDDGEIYTTPDLDSGFAQPAESAPKTGFFKKFFGVFRSASGKTVVQVEIPFRQGDRVRDLFGNKGVVIGIDLSAEHGLGKISVQFDDGRVVSMAGAAHGLEKVDTE
jgi:hypothetical protein